MEYTKENFDKMEAILKELLIENEIRNNLSFPIYERIEELINEPY